MTRGGDRASCPSAPSFIAPAARTPFLTPGCCTLLRPCGVLRRATPGPAVRVRARGAYPARLHVNISTVLHRTLQDGHYSPDALFVGAKCCAAMCRISVAARATAAVCMPLSNLYRELLTGDAIPARSRTLTNRCACRDRTHRLLRVGGDEALRSCGDASKGISDPLWLFDALVGVCTGASSSAGSLFNCVPRLLAPRAFRLTVVEHLF
jgi:hypothetical protein